MPLMFNALLESEGISPGDVRLLRHQDRIGARSVYRLWREDRAAFEEYQSGQAATTRSRFASRYWASFVAAPDGGTLFAGLYRVNAWRPVEEDIVMPLLGSEAKAGVIDLYDLTLCSELAAYSGLLTIAWGDGMRSWVQRADNQNKPILELRRQFQEPAFPGFAAFMTQLSEIETLPLSWITALAAARGVYLLTCPKTFEQYVGAAYGADGLIGRWRAHAAVGGDSMGLRSRDPSDYRVSILEVAGSAASMEDICAMETLWKRKLQSGEMGLNRN